MDEFFPSQRQSSFGDRNSSLDILVFQFVDSCVNVGEFRNSLGLWVSNSERGVIQLLNMNGQLGTVKKMIFFRMIL